MSDQDYELFIEDETEDRWFSYALTKAGTKLPDEGCPFRFVISEARVRNFLKFIESCPEALVHLESFVRAYQRWMQK